MPRARRDGGAPGLARPSAIEDGRSPAASVESLLFAVELALAGSGRPYRPDPADEARVAALVSGIAHVADRILADTLHATTARRSGA